MYLKIFRSWPSEIFYYITNKSKLR